MGVSFLVHSIRHKIGAVDERFPGKQTAGRSARAEVRWIRSHKFRIGHWNTAQLCRVKVLAIVGP